VLNLGTATLLVGFNRPELIEKRLAEISKFSNLKLYISIDGPRKKSNDAKNNNEILKIIEKWKTKLDIVEIIHKKNIGLALNITSSIEKVLESNESIFVIEDDVSVSNEAYESIICAKNFANPKNATVGGFGFINRPLLNARLGLKNQFRETPYFSAWGWCIDRNTFSNYVLDLSSIKIAKELRDSKIWNMLDAREREIWICRFDRVLKDPFYTWDLQMQFMSFKFEKMHYLPLFRIIENEGFNDPRGTHIKGRKPRWYIGDNSILKMSPNLYTEIRVIKKLWIWLDRYTWVQTRKIDIKKWLRSFKIRLSS